MTHRGWEINKGIYVLSFTADLNQAQGSKVEDVIAAYNETLPTVAPAAVAHAGMKYLLTAVSNIFPRVRPDQPVSLSGGGILLWPTGCWASRDGDRGGAAYKAVLEAAPTRRLRGLESTRPPTAPREVDSISI